MTKQVTFVERPDGRRIDVHRGGDPDGSPIVFLHGTPGCGRPLDVVDRAFVRHRLHSIGPARPGFGSSTRCPGRSVGDAAADTATVLDQLGVDRCVVAGWSGGGPLALACAAFDVAAIDVPTLLWHGALDNLGSAAHTRWLAERIPGAVAHVETNEGHLSIVVNRIDAMLEELAALARPFR